MSRGRDKQDDPGGWWWITGLTAALEAAATGYEVRLVEKSDKLGGWLAKQHKTIPTKPPFSELEDTDLEDILARIEADKRITVSHRRSRLR